MNLVAVSAHDAARQNRCSIVQVICWKRVVRSISLSDHRSYISRGDRVIRIVKSTRTTTDRPVRFMDARFMLAPPMGTRLRTGTRESYRFSRFLPSNTARYFATRLRYARNQTFLNAAATQGRLFSAARRRTRGMHQESARCPLFFDNVLLHTFAPTFMFTAGFRSRARLESCCRTLKKNESRRSI